MRKFIILIFSLLIGNILFTQEKAVKITNEISKKEIIIKENKRIKIKTVDGIEISGRFKIDNNTILIENEKIELSDIEEIKRNPLLISIISSAFFIYVGAITVGLGVLIGALAEASGFFLIIPGAALIYLGIKSPNFSRKFKTDANWTLEVITIPQ